MKKTALIGGLAVAGVLTGASAAAEEAAVGKGWAHAGPVAVRFDSDTRLRVADADVPTANATASNNLSLAVEVGYEVLPATIVSLTVGLPPTTTLRGRGAPVDGIELGRVMYGPAVLSAHYHVDLGPVRPYVGAGVNYTIVLHESDRAVADLKVRNAWGAVLQAGLDVPFTGGWFVFADLKKIFLKTKATGTVPAFGNPPAEATVRLDPLLVHAGVGWRF